MIEAAVVVPAAPLLLPGVTGRPVPEVDTLRAACVGALAAVRGRVVVVGAEPARHVSPVPRPQIASETAISSTRTAKRDTPAGHPSALARIAPGLAGGAAGVLPVELAVGHALLEVAGLEPDDFERLPPTLSAPQALDVGRRLAADPRPTSLVVLADGTPCRRESGSPVRFDPRARAFDEQLLAALTSGAADALAGLDAGLARALQMSGHLPLQVLAGALPSPASTRIRYADDPFGVFYVVATWTA